LWPHHRLIASGVGLCGSDGSSLGWSREFVFLLLEKTNHINLYKNLIKIQIFNINLGTIGDRPLPTPLVSAPACSMHDCSMRSQRRMILWRRHLRALITLENLLVDVVVPTVESDLPSGRRPPLAVAGQLTPPRPVRRTEAIVKNPSIPSIIPSEIKPRFLPADASASHGNRPRPGRPGRREMVRRPW
jgi:hypothetical protein